MKIALTLLVVGLVLGLVVPYFIQDTVSGAGIQLPSFPWSNTPPQSYSFSVPVVLRVIGAIFVTLAIVRFIWVRTAR